MVQFRPVCHVVWTGLSSVCLSFFLSSPLFLWISIWQQQTRFRGLTLSFVSHGMNCSTNRPRGSLSVRPSSLRSADSRDCNLERRARLMRYAQCSGHPSAGSGWRSGQTHQVVWTTDNLAYPIGAGNFPSLCLFFNFPIPCYPVLFLSLCVGRLVTWLTA